MAKIKGKGTILEMDVDGVLTAVAQVISVDQSGMESLTFDSDTLDNTSAGKPYDPTGESEGGTCGFEFFFDAALTGHKAMLELIANPSDYIDVDWQLTYATSPSPTAWPFVGAGFGMDVTVVLNDGVKASATVKLDGLPTFP